MELFHRTVSMKQVENITSFVRTNMLEEDDVDARISNLIHHFDDLKKAHDAVLRAKDQIALLTPITEGAAQHAALSREDELARQQRDQLHPWFTDRKLQLSLEHQAELETHRRTAAGGQRASWRTEITGNSATSCPPSRRTSAPTAAAGWPPSMPTSPGSATSPGPSGSASRRTPQPRRTWASGHRRTVSCSTRNRARLADVEKELGAQSDELQESRTELTMTRTVLTGTRRPTSPRN